MAGISAFGLGNNAHLIVTAPDVAVAHQSAPASERAVSIVEMERLLEKPLGLMLCSGA